MLYSYWRSSRRVQHYEKGLILSDTDPERIVKEITEFAVQTLKIEDLPVHEEKILFVGEEISSASRYRVEHFREQLFYQGYASDFIQMEDSDAVCMEYYRALVLYRCSDLEKVSITIQKHMRQGKIYYDIDDLIFDYDRISGIHFLKNGKGIGILKKSPERFISAWNSATGILPLRIRWQKKSAGNSRKRKWSSIEIVPVWRCRCCLTCSGTGGKKTGKKILYRVFQRIENPRSGL